MSKKIRNLLSEIDKKFKDSEEGIEIIDTLQSKLENAPTQNQKEKFESEMKKEIKKLQRLRDFFRTNQNNPDIKDKSKLDQGRKMIENEMERFREHEKEFKMKQYSKRALMADYERKDNFVRGDSDSDNSRSYGDSDDYGSQNSDNDYGSDQDQPSNEEDDEVASDQGEEVEIDNGGIDDPQQLAKDKQWLDTFIADKLKKQITQVEQEVDNIRNKKIRGALKKQKDMLKTLNDKLKLMRQTREKCEELAMTMEFLEGGAIKGLKQHLRKYHEDVDNETLRNNVDKQVLALLDLADKNRKAEDVLGGMHADGNEDEEEKKQSESSDSQKYGHLSWLHDILDLSLSENQNIIRTKAIANVQELKVGQIIDAQDYLGSWHLSVVCKVQPNNEQELVKLNFLEYPRGNRDEWISRSEQDRVSGPFVNSAPNRDPEYVKKSISSLNDYIQTKIVASSGQKQGTKQQAKAQQQAQLQKAASKPVTQPLAPISTPTTQTTVSMKKEEKTRPVQSAPIKHEELKKEEDIPRPIPKQQPQQSIPQRKGKASQNNKVTNKKSETSKASDEAPQKYVAQVIEKTINEPEKELGIAASVLGQDAVGQIGGANIIGGSGLFQGPNPFQNLAGQFNSIQESQKQGGSIFSANDSNSSFNPMGIAAQALGANSGTNSALNSSTQEEGPPLNFKHNQGDTSSAIVNEMLNSSFKNIPLMQDQDFLCAQFDIKCPLPVDDSILLAENEANKQQIKQDQSVYRYFPTSAMFNRQSNFQRMDLESLFFAFYYQQGTYQQYLAALELKKRGWEFHMRFQTWIKKEVTQEYTRGGKQQTKTKTIYFDFENEWKTKTNNTFDIQMDDPKAAHQIENELLNPQLPANIAISPPNDVWIEAMNCLSQDQFEKQFSISEIRTSQLQRQVLDQLCS